jgi:hypothetical protein
MQPKTEKKKSFSLKSFSFENILQWKIFNSETNGALVRLITQQYSINATIATSFFFATSTTN